MNMRSKTGRPGPRGPAAAIIALALAGCATGPRIVQTEVTSFNQWSTLPSEKTYVFARTLEFQNSLELKTYEDMVRDELAGRGFRLAAVPDQANLVVTLRPSVSGTTVRIRDRWPFDPYWSGPYGGFYGPGRFGFGDPYWNSRYFGRYDRGFDDTTVEVFKRRLEIDIDSRTIAGKRFYEGRVESTGETGSLPRAVPVLVRALFTDFPGNDGQTRQVDVAVERRPAETR